MHRYNYGCLGAEGWGGVNKGLFQAKTVYPDKTNYWNPSPLPGGVAGNWQGAEFRDIQSNSEKKNRPPTTDVSETYTLLKGVPFEKNNVHENLDKFLPGGIKPLATQQRSRGRKECQ